MVADKAVEFIQQVKVDDRPFFLWVTPYATHAPHVPARRHRGTLAGLTIPRTPAFNESDTNIKGKVSGDCWARFPAAFHESDIIDGCGACGSPNLDVVPVLVPPCVCCLRASLPLCVLPARVPPCASPDAPAGCALQATYYRNLPPISEDVARALDFRYQSRAETLLAVDDLIERVIKVRPGRCHPAGGTG